MTNNGRWHPRIGLDYRRRLDEACANIARLRAAGAPLPNVGLEALESGHVQVGSAVGRMMVDEWLVRYAQPLELAVNRMECERERGSHLK